MNTFDIWTIQLNHLWCFDEVSTYILSLWCIRCKILPRRLLPIHSLAYLIGNMPLNNERKYFFHIFADGEAKIDIKIIGGKYKKKTKKKKKGYKNMSQKRNSFY